MYCPPRRSIAQSRQPKQSARALAESTAGDILCSLPQCASHSVSPFAASCVFRPADCWATPWKAYDMTPGLALKCSHPSGAVEMIVKQHLTIPGLDPPKESIHEPPSLPRSPSGPSLAMSYPTSQDAPCGATSRARQKYRQGDLATLAHEMLPPKHSMLEGFIPLGGDAVRVTEPSPNPRAAASPSLTFEPTLDGMQRSLESCTSFPTLPHRFC